MLMGNNKSVAIRIKGVKIYHNKIHFDCSMRASCRDMFLHINTQFYKQHQLIPFK